VAALPWNQWQLSRGMGGRLRLESVATLVWNTQLYQASDVEIDHVVPLEWAWERGAWRWSGQKRETFANDPVNLLAVEDELNSSTITI